MKKSIIITIISFIMFSCNDNSESFKNVPFGRIPKKTFLKQMLDNKTFSVFKDDLEKKNDTTGITYTWVYKNKKFPMGVHFNEEFWTDRYNFGSLRRMEFTMGENTKEYKRVYRFCGKVSKKIVDDLFESYIDVYGKPDSIIPQYKYKSSFNDFFSGTKSNNKKIDNQYISGKKAVWINDNFKLVFDIPFTKKTKSNESVFYQKDYESRVRIYYEMIDYDKEFKKIQDSIAKTFTPKDLVYMTTGDCEWSQNYNSFNDARLTIKLLGIHRKDREEPRRIKGIRFDLIITDSFKTELYKAEDLTIELPSQSYLESRPEKGKFGQVMSVDLNRLFWTDFNSHGNSKLVYLKKYSENNNVIVSTSIKTILFENGSVLNSY